MNETKKTEPPRVKISINLIYKKRATFYSSP
jgi:hypothetical protein